MGLTLDDDLRLAEARRLVARCVDKAEALEQRGTFIVVDASGAPVSASRMDGAGSGALPIVRAKAFAAAVNSEPSARFAARMAQFHAGIFDSYQRALRDQPFPGGGAVLVERAGRVTGAIATGVGIGPFVKLPNVPMTAFLVQGQPANLEDLIISYALGGSYSPQHGDDVKRWIEAYGAPPPADQAGTGLDEAPPSRSQKALAHATVLADYALGLAEAQKVRIAVAIVDRRGDVVRLDRMDSAAPMSVDLAEGVASAAVNFQLRTADIAGAFADSAVLSQIMARVPFRMAVVGGGALLCNESQIDGAIGIAGVHPDMAQQLADAVSAKAPSLSKQE